MTERVVLRVFLIIFLTGFAKTVNAQSKAPQITDFQKLDSTSVELKLDDDRHIILDFYGKNIFRVFADSLGKELHPPKSDPEAQILVDQPRAAVGEIELDEENGNINISSTAVKITFDKENTLFKIENKLTGKIVAEAVKPFQIGRSRTSFTLKEKPSEYFYGGGVQNGRFSHKGKKIAIANENSWTDGGVASPNPFYWSTEGYGVMWYNFKKGKYDFGSGGSGEVNLYHETDYLDLFFMVNDGAAALLNDYYQLTGNPVLMPKFAFYEGHLNAYNRDYWKEDSTGILFEDGKKYKESQKDNGGIKESLNGEKDNYQFSARAVIDRYKNADMPLGWILPNDGYGAGYGQDSTLEGNIQNLKEFGDYSRQNGIELGLWTQSDLHPKPDVKALLQRDIVNEVKEAGVRALKTDVAWVGPGYSFGLNGIADVAETTIKYGNNARPFIITLDGWAGTQRYAGVWSGDQTGGNWEYIRFHIPTYIGAGLSGEPNITSDMDGIFGGGNLLVNIRDFEWKTFSPMELNMDGWGSNPKYPQALGEPATSINRNYLKLKSEIQPYTYSIAQKAVTGLPMIRAMFFQKANDFTLGKATQYQYMYGPYFLVAPIFEETEIDEDGNDIRHGIYLPEGTWYDYFTGTKYKGGQIINYFDAPLWKLPVFVKSGAIIPMHKPHNNVAEINDALRIYDLYPSENSSFTHYDDDGKTEEYKSGKYTTTMLHSELNKRGKVEVIIGKTKGDFEGFEKDKATLLRFNVSQEPKKVRVKIDGKRIRLKHANSKEEFKNKDNIYYYEPEPDFNQFATADSAFSKKKIIRNPQFLVKLETTDITKTSIQVRLKNYRFDIANNLRESEGELQNLKEAPIHDSDRKPFSLRPRWQKVSHADFYEIKFQDMLYTHIKDTSFVFRDLEPDSNYNFKLSAVNKTGQSDWVNIQGKTTFDPLRYAIPNISGYSAQSSQGGFKISHLFDLDDTSLWHTKYQEKAVPFDIVMDLRSVNDLDKVQYLPRKNGANGIITKATLYYSMNKKDWIKAGEINWAANNKLKEFKIDGAPTARYMKLNITEGRGDYGSGREFYIFKVPGTSSFIPGDINEDEKIDNNDLTSYINYTGLRRGDSDFEGYISKGDINKNDLIDAFDISNVTTQLEGGVRIDSVIDLKGKLHFSADKETYKKGETITIKVSGDDLKEVNALSFALPYDTKAYEFINIKPINIKQMGDLTNDRLHSNGQKALYPTFVNIGNQETLNGSKDLFEIRLKAEKDLTFKLDPIDGVLVSKDLNQIHLWNEKSE